MSSRKRENQDPAGHPQRNHKQVPTSFDFDVRKELLEKKIVDIEKERLHDQFQNKNLLEENEKIEKLCKLKMSEKEVELAMKMVELAEKEDELNSTQKELKDLKIEFGLQQLNHVKELEKTSLKNQVGLKKLQDENKKIKDFCLTEYKKIYKKEAKKRVQRENNEEVRNNNMELKEDIVDLKSLPGNTKELNDTNHEWWLLKKHKESCALWRSDMEQQNQDLNNKLRIKDDKILKLDMAKTNSDKKHAVNLKSMLEYSQLNVELNAKIKALNKEVQSKGEKHEIEKQELMVENSNTLKEVQTQNEMLQKKAHDLQLQLDTMKNDLNDKFKAQLAKQKQEIVHATNKRTKAQAILMNSRDEELKKAKVQLDDLKKATKEKDEAEKTELNDLKSEADLKGQLIEMLESQIKTLTDELDTKDENLKNLIEGRVAEKAKVCKVLTDIFRKIKAEKRKYDEEVSVLNIKCQKMEKELEASGKKCEMKKGENKRLFKEAKILEGKHSETISSLKNLVESKSEDLKAVQLQLEESENVYQTKTFPTIVELKNKNIEMKHKADNASKLNHEFKSQIEILNQEVDSKNSMVETLEKKVVSLQNIAKLEEEKYKNTIFQSTTERESNMVFEDFKRKLIEGDSTLAYLNPHLVNGEVNKKRKLK